MSQRSSSSSNGTTSTPTGSAAGPALAVPGAALPAPETVAARVAFTAVVEQAIVLVIVVPLSRPAPGPSHHVG